MHEKHENSNSIGERLKYIRKNFRFTRKYFREKYNIPEITLQKWETSERKIPDHAIIKLLEIFKKECILVTKDWLQNGIGEKPKTIFPDNELNYSTLYFDFSQNDEILANKEIEFFENNHKNSKVIIIDNNDMEPIYKPGDYIGGIELTKDEIKNLDNTDCIVLIKNDNSYLLRRVNKDEKGNFRLSILNLNSKNETPVIYNAKLEFIAPVIWIRRPNLFKLK